MSERSVQEVEITRLKNAQDKLTRQLSIYDCNKLYQELKDIKAEKVEVEGKIEILLKNSESNKDKIEQIGHALYEHYSLKMQSSIKGQDNNDKDISDKEHMLDNLDTDKKNNERIIREKSIETGSLKNSVESYNDIEEAFNRKFSCDIKRNILGLYEEGTLEVKQKELDEEKQEENNRLSRLYKKKNELDIKARKLLQEEVDIVADISDVMHKMSEQENILTDLEHQKNSRIKILKYAGLEELALDRPDVIISSLVNNINQLEIDKKKLVMSQSELEKQYAQLKEGKTIELPDNVRNYCEQNDIRYVYGMEWLNKNGRTQESNGKLVENNPFIPYSIIMDKNAFERIKLIDEKYIQVFQYL